MAQDVVERIYGDLVRGELPVEELSARRVARRLGLTTGALYHHFGSFDGFLFAVSQRGFADLGTRLSDVWDATEQLTACAQAYVEFGLDHPALYALMLERQYDWDALRAGGAFEETTPGHALLARVVSLVEAAGSKRPLTDTRLLMAGLHGLVSLAASGRMNVGDLGTPDREVAIAGARDLARRVLSPSLQKEDR